MEKFAMQKRFWDFSSISGVTTQRKKGECGNVIVKGYCL